MPKNNNTVIANLSTLFSQNVENRTGKAILRAAGGVIVGLLSARAEIFDKCAPFGIASVAAAGPKDSIFVMIGAMAGYMLPNGPAYAIRYVATVVAVFLFKWVLSGFEELVAHPAFVPCLAGIAAAITGAALVIAGDKLPYDILILFIETLLCGCAAVFFSHAFEYIRKPSGLWGLSQHELISVTITICVMLLALEKVQFSGVSIGRIAAVAAIICAARYGKETGGAVMGITSGMMLSLAGGPAARMIIGYGFGGLIAGVFAPLGKLACAVAFILANAVAGITESLNITETLTAGYEVISAAAIFMILPERVLCRLSGLFVPAHDSGEKRLRENMYNRLTEAATALEEISDMVSEIHRKLRRKNTVDISAVYDDAAEITCKKCGLRLYCWGTVYNDTMNALNDVTEILKKNKSLTRDDMPKHFSARCCKLSEFIAAVNSSYAQFASRRMAELKNEQLRSMMAPSLSNSACLLRDIAAEFASSRKLESGSDRVRAALAACGINSSSSSLYIDARGRLMIEAEIDGRSTGISREKLLEALRSTCGRALEGPRITRDEENDTLRLLFIQKPQYSVKFGEAAIQKTGETLCGDACESFVDERGRAMLLLSDGMGCGGGAAVDSNLTIGLMSRLLRCGFGFDEAARITATAMMVKSDEESFSTLDIACIDLYDGTATFLKAGAPPTYVRRCGRVERIERASMPIGILPNVQLERATTRLRAGDLVVVLSDGALYGDDSFIIKAIENFSGEPRTFAKQLAETARRLRNDGHNDDITVMAAVIE